MYIASRRKMMRDCRINLRTVHFQVLRHLDRPKLIQHGLGEDMSKSALSRSVINIGNNALLRRHSTEPHRLLIQSLLDVKEYILSNLLYSQYRIQMCQAHGSKAPVRF